MATDVREFVRTIGSVSGGERRDPVRFDHRTRAVNATGGSNYRQVASGAVIVPTIHICRDCGAPVLIGRSDTSAPGTAAVSFGAAAGARRRK